MGRTSIATTVDLSLTKCQHQAMAKAFAYAAENDAFSVVTKISPRGYLEVSTYLKQPEPSARTFSEERKRGAVQQDEKEKVPTRSPALDEATVDGERSVRPASPPPDRPAKKLQKEAPSKSAWTKVVRREPAAARKVDKNLLSARGDGGQGREPLGADGDDAAQRKRKAKVLPPPNVSKDAMDDDSDADRPVDTGKGSIRLGDVEVWCEGYLLPNGNGTARACGDNAEGRIPRLRGRNHRTGERYDGLVSRLPKPPGPRALVKSVVSVRDVAFFF